MPVEKTVEELFEEYAGLWRERQYCEKIGVVCISCIRDSERMSQILQEVKQQVRREVVEEIYEGIHIFDHYNKIDKDIKELLNIEFKDSIKRFALSKGIILKN